MDKFARFAEFNAAAKKNGVPGRPLTELDPEFSLSDGYSFSERQALEYARRTGSPIVGKKIGLTSKTLQEVFKVSAPVYGHLLGDSEFENGATISAGTFISPRAEGEVAFIFTDGFDKSQATRNDILGATEIAMAIEIVDGRIKMPFKIQDLVADNSAAAGYILHGKRHSSRTLDLATAKMTAKKNGEISATGSGAEVMGDPVNSVVWLANQILGRGDSFRKGDIVLSGSFAPVGMPFTLGDTVEIEIHGLGSASFKYG